MHKHHLFSPSRMEWLRKKTRGCLFCRVLKDDPEIPKMVLYKGKGVAVIMNMFPYNTGHLQVLPLRHVENMEDLSEKEMSALFLTVRKCLKLLKKVLQPKGFNIGINQGVEVSGASVPHLHVHIVPRFSNDFGFMEVIAGTKVIPESLEQTFEKLKKEAGILE